MSYSHKWHKIAEDEYRISWVIDNYYSGSRLRFPHRKSRDTNLKGCIRFCKKWNLPLPQEKECHET